MTTPMVYSELAAWQDTQHQHEYHLPPTAIDEEIDLDMLPDEDLDDTYGKQCRKLHQEES